MADRNAPARRSAFFRGEAGVRQGEAEREHQKQRAEERRAQSNQPFRFRISPGKSTQIIICDDKPDFFMYEHALKDSEGNYGRVFSGCVRTFDNCPVCEMQSRNSKEKRESYYALMLTCIDLTPFKTKSGDEVEFSRKLLVVKPQQQKKFLRFYQKEGTLRGAKFTMTRDGDKDSAIGNDIEFEEFVDEKEMRSYYRTWKDRDGKKHEEECDVPFDYIKDKDHPNGLFEEPTTESLRALVDGDDAPGSRRQEERELGGRDSRRPRRGEEDRPARSERSESRRPSRGKDDDWEDDDDQDAPFDPDPPRGRGRGRDEEDEKPARGRRPARGEAEEEPEERPARRTRREEPEDSKPSRGARSRREEPEDEPEEEAPRRTRSTATPDSRRKAAEPAEEPEDEQDDEQDDPPPRRPATRPASGPSRSGPPPRRAAREEPEEDEQDDPPPRRGRTAPEEDAPSRSTARRARR